MATFTASELTSAPKAFHSGVISKSAIVTASTTGTASSVFKLVKIPMGATIVDFIWSAEDGGTNQTYELGVRTPYSDTTTVSESALCAATSTTGGVMVRGGSKLPYKLTFDNTTYATGANGAYAWVEAKAVAAISASAIHKITVFYTMDGS